MPDRATYLARTILSRLRSLEAALADAGDDLPQEGGRRAEVVRKVLAVEEGITFGPTVSTVIAALPGRSLNQLSNDRDLQELASVLRRELKLT